MAKPPPEERDGVRLTSLDDEVFAGAGATKRDLIDYLDAVADRLVPVLSGRPLSVVRTTGATPFMQKNAPKGTPAWVATTDVWAETSQRTVRYVLADDRRTLLWLGNQRAVELHPTLGRLPEWWRATDLVLDLDPPDVGDAAGSFRAAVAVAHLVRSALDEVGLTGFVKTSGAKGVHIFVPLAAGAAGGPDDVAAATRALAARAEALDPSIATTAYLRADRGGRVFVDATRSGGATVVSAYSPRARPGLPVSFPLAWDEIDDVTPGDFTIANAPALLAGRTSWEDLRREPQQLPPALIAEGHEIPIPRVAAMHEGKRRKREGAAAPDQ